MEVRKQAINWLKQNPDILLGFAAQGEGHFSAPTYLANMARPGEWGDEIMLMAISQAYNVSILVSSGRDPETGDFNVTIYPHNATGPHYACATLSSLNTMSSCSLDPFSGSCTCSGSKTCL